MTAAIETAPARRRRIGRRGLAPLLILASMLVMGLLVVAPLAVVVFFAISMLAPSAGGWAAPALFFSLATIPATWSLVKEVWPKSAQNA